MPNASDRFVILGAPTGATVGSVVVSDGQGFVCTRTADVYFASATCNPGTSTTMISKFVASSGNGIAVQLEAVGSSNVAAQVWRNESGAIVAALGIVPASRDFFYEAVTGSAGSETYNRCFTIGRSTGVTTTKAHAVGQQSLSGAGAVDIVNGTTLWTTTGANAGTLANGIGGQRKTIIMVADGGDGTLTPTTKTGFTTITFTAVGQSVTLEYVTTLGWVIVSNNGCTIA